MKQLTGILLIAISAASFGTLADLRALSLCRWPGYIHHAVPAFWLRGVTHADHSIGCARKNFRMEKSSCN